MPKVKKNVAGAEAVQIHPLCGQTVKLANITDHISLEESKKITLYDAVTRTGFVHVVLRRFEGCEPVVLIQSVEQI